MHRMQRRNLYQQQQPQQQLHSTHAAPSITTVISNGITTLSQQQALNSNGPQQKQQSLYNNLPSNTMNRSINTSKLSQHVPPLQRVGNGGGGGGGGNISTSILRTWVLICIIIILTLLISLFPDERQMIIDTEQQLEKVMLETEHQLEHDVMDYWLSSKEYYTGDSSSSSSRHSDTTSKNTMYAADMRMQQQSLSSNKWVNDEKKLKRALQVLVDRQQRGIDLGVPVLTRYLGETIPVFYSKDDISLNNGIATIDEWYKLIETKYTEMRNEENHWREIVTSTLLSEDRG